MNDNPYIHTQINEQVFLREFSHNVNTEELVWHRDRKDRTVTVLEGVGWMIQFDNCLPISLKVGESIFVPKNTYHRLHRGSDQLTVKIVES